MSYKKPSLADKRKLCPRCGAPMMSKSETLKYCPVCHFSESTKKTLITIKMDTDEKAEDLPKIELFRVTKGGTAKEFSLETEYSYVVVDRNANTLWIWKGTKSSPGDAYKAGVETTKLKSSLRMYSAQIKRVEEGEEPAEFPTIGDELRAAEEDRQRIKEEEGRKRQEAEDQRRSEEEGRKRQEAEDQRRSEEEERKRQEAQKVDSEVWKTVAAATVESKPAEIKSTPPEIESKPVESGIDVSELQEAISSLTLVRGINEDIAKTLYKANVTTIMELSLGDPEEIAAKSGLEISVVRELVGNAKDLLGFD